MKKSSLNVLSILSIAGSLVLSVEASMIKENDTDFIPQLQHSSTISEEQVFNRKDCYRAIAQKHDDLNSFKISEEEKLAIIFEIGKLYYDFAKNSKDLEEKEAYYEEAKVYFRKSKLSQAKKYLAEIM